MGTLRRAARRSIRGAKNALELMRVGRLGQPYGAPYEVVDRGPHHRLRRYATCDALDAPIALFVPPLMITSEVYDIEEQLSAVKALGRHGVLPFVVDFGSPEDLEGGMTRTLDDHVLAVVTCVRRVRELTGRSVHLLGYSQGGMFAYQAAAYLRSESIASIVTFGSPVDIHRGIPILRNDAAAAILRVLEPAVAYGLEKVEGLPAALTATGFKLLSPRKEVEQRIDFLRKLHDRGALERRESRRDFLNGAGFVAWPGPAFRNFVDQFIVHNRMLSGGFVLNGKTATLADLTCPILCFIGRSDELARPAAVKAVARAAPDAAVSTVTVSAGHFGIVVGSNAMRNTWPVVGDWILHQEQMGPLPLVLEPAPPGPTRVERLDDEPEGAAFDVDVDFDLFVDAVADTARSMWRRATDLVASTSDAYDSIRYQEPRLRALAELLPESRVNPGLWLAERAAADPGGTFFLWQGRAFTYQEANRRIDAVVRGLYACGVRPGQRVLVLMRSRPSLLAAVTALVRLGAVAVLAPPDGEAVHLAPAQAAANCSVALADPKHATLAQQSGLNRVLVLGGGGKHRTLTEGLVDMEAIDVAGSPLPDGFQENPGRAKDLGAILLRPTDSGRLRLVMVTHHRWALSALGAAAACTLTPDDTVYGCIPLHHPAGILVSVGAALAAGSRLALTEQFEPDRFFREVRRYGATVVFYAGEMLRPLLRRAPSPADRTLPLRLFAGSGMRSTLWQTLSERYGVSVMEFYASTSHRLIMANASGAKTGAVGRKLPGSEEPMVVRCDLAARMPLLDADGHVTRAAVDEAGILAARLSADDQAPEEVRLAGGDRLLLTNDVVRRDAQGDFWFLDSLAGHVAVGDQVVSLRAVEDAFYALPEINQVAAVFREGQIQVLYASASPLSDSRLASVTLWEAERPQRIRHCAHIPESDGFRPRREAVIAMLAAP